MKILEIKNIVLEMKNALNGLISVNTTEERDLKVLKSWVKACNILTHAKFVSQKDK